MIVKLGDLLGDEQPGPDLTTIQVAYLASRYSRHPEMQGIRDVLNRAFGISVSSRWIDCHTDMTGDFSSSFTREILNDPSPEIQEACGTIAVHDIEDLSVADTVISFTGNEAGSKGGRHVEFGVAYAMQKQLIIVGPRENAFHTLPGIMWFHDWSRLVMALTQERGVI